MDSLAFIEQSGSRKKLHSVYVLQGDEDFLKRQALLSLRSLVFGEEQNEFGFSRYAGDKVEFAAIRNELETVPFLCPHRLVVVDNADPFVTRFRSALEKYVAEPAATGILVLDVKTWPATTKLAKLVDSAGTIVCKAPAAYRLGDWCIKWAASRHGKQLGAPAAKLLVDLVGAEMGMLDQELAKLAIFVGSSSRIETKEVDQLVGNSRAEKVFRIFDAIGAGDSGNALGLLDRLLNQGEDPHRILGAFSLQLRRLAQASALCRDGKPLGVALEQVDIPPFARQSCEQQMRHLGRRRADKLYSWLLEADLGLKGGSQLPPRTLLERLVVQLAKKEK
ncbi:MAG TPA: DNA polymerase III subunit delta [Gemmataceae bacterium]|nr:DNA polymerase III subunit delta [Gemmataceae bacterium]